MSYNQKVSTAIVLCLGVILGCLVHSFRSGSHIAGSAGDDAHKIMPHVHESLVQVLSSQPFVKADDTFVKPWGDDDRGAKSTNEDCDFAPLNKKCPELDPEEGEAPEVCACVSRPKLTAEAIQKVEWEGPCDSEGEDRCAKSCEDAEKVSEMSLRFYDWKLATITPRVESKNQKMLPQLLEDGATRAYVISTCETNVCECFVFDKQDKMDDRTRFQLFFRPLDLAWVAQYWFWEGPKNDEEANKKYLAEQAKFDQKKHNPDKEANRQRTNGPKQELCVFTSPRHRRGEKRKVCNIQEKCAKALEGLISSVQIKQLPESYEPPPPAAGVPERGVAPVGRADGWDVIENGKSVEETIKEQVADALSPELIREASGGAGGETAAAAEGGSVASRTAAAALILPAL